MNDDENDSEKMMKTVMKTIVKMTLKMNRSSSPYFFLVSCLSSLCWALFYFVEVPCAISRVVSLQSREVDASESQHGSNK